MWPTTEVLGKLLLKSSELRSEARRFLQKPGFFGKTGLLGAVFMLGTLLGWCHTVRADQNAEHEAVKSAEAWLILIDEGRYEEVWEAAAEYVKNSVRKKRWLTSLTDARKPLGKVISRKLRSVRQKTGLPGAPCFDCFNENIYFVIQYDTVFENNISATETVTPITLMTGGDGKWRFFDYDIRQIRIKR